MYFPSKRLLFLEKEESFQRISDIKRERELRSKVSSDKYLKVSDVKG